MTLVRSDLVCEIGAEVTEPESPVGFRPSAVACRAIWSDDVCIFTAGEDGTV